MEDSSNTIVGNMRGMMKQMEESMVERMIEIQNGRHPLQAETVRQQYRDICDLNNENLRLRNKLEEMEKNFNIGGNLKGKGYLEVKWPENQQVYSSIVATKKVGKKVDLIHSNLLEGKDREKYRSWIISEIKAAIHNKSCPRFLRSHMVYFNLPLHLQSMFGLDRKCRTCN